MATRATIRTYARLRGDHPGSFPSDADYNALIDSAARWVWRQLIRAGWAPQDSEVFITNAVGAAAYSLNTSLHIVKEVYRVDGTTYTEIPRIKDEERASYLTRGEGPAERYDTIGGATSVMQIRFFPVPTSGAYEIRYTPRFPGFTDDTDTWYGPDGSEDLIGLKAAIMAKRDKEGDDTRALEQEADQLLADISDHASWVDQRNPATVRDVRGVADLTSPFDHKAGEGWA